MENTTSQIKTVKLTPTTTMEVEDDPGFEDVDKAVATQSLGTVIVKLTLKGNNLDFKGVEAQGRNSAQMLKIMARRVLLLDTHLLGAKDEKLKQWRNRGLDMKAP